MYGATVEVSTEKKDRTRNASLVAVMPSDWDEIEMYGLTLGWYNNVNLHTARNTYRFKWFIGLNITINIILSEIELVMSSDCRWFMITSCYKNITWTAAISNTIASSFRSIGFVRVFSYHFHINFGLSLSINIDCIGDAVFIASTHHTLFRLAQRKSQIHHYIQGFGLYRDCLALMPALFLDGFQMTHSIAKRDRVKIQNDDLIPIWLAFY